MAQDYNNTLNLPVTEFNMRGALPQRETCMGGRMGRKETVR